MPPAAVTVPLSFRVPPAFTGALPGGTPRPEIASLTRALATGNEAAFREFHARYFDRLYYFLLVVTRGDAHTAHDALQETLLRVCRHAREFDHPDIFWGWLKAVARNAARDVGRKQRRYISLLQRFSASPQPESNREEETVTTLLHECLAELPPEDRALVEGKYLHGSTVEELAESRQLTPKAVESRLYRLRRDLAQALLQRLNSR